MSARISHAATTALAALTFGWKMTAAEHEALKAELRPAGLVEDVEGFRFGRLTPAGRAALSTALAKDREERQAWAAGGR